MSSKAKLGTILGLGSARSGTHHWIVQRGTALAGLPLAIFILGLFAALKGSSEEEIRALIGFFPISVGIVLSIVVFFWHMRLGMQIIIEDYVHGRFSKPFALFFNVFWCFFWAISGIFAVVKIGLGG